MAVKLKTWVWVVIGIVAVGILGVIAMAGIGAYYFARHIEATQATPEVAATEFDAVRARFAGQRALIELDEDGRLRKANTDRPAPPDAQPPDALHVLAFDPDDGGMVKVTVPFWLLRLQMGGGTIDLSGNRVDLEDLKLTVEDLERFGPTLVLDQANSGGDRVLVWTQ